MTRLGDFATGAVANPAYVATRTEWPTMLGDFATGAVAKPARNTTPGGVAS